MRSLLQMIFISLEFIDLYKLSTKSVFSSLNCLTAISIVDFSYKTDLITTPSYTYCEIMYQIDRRAHV